jgi:hypothetical protein
MDYAMQMNRVSIATLIAVQCAATGRATETRARTTAQTTAVRAEMGCASFKKTMRNPVVSIAVVQVIRFVETTAVSLIE